MNEYKVGKDIGEILARLNCLEEKVSLLSISKKPCSCREGDDNIMNVRIPTKEEEKYFHRPKKEGNVEKLPLHCLYAVTGIIGAACPGGSPRIGDVLCISPCPPCPQILRLRIVDGNGNQLCMLAVNWANQGVCAQCPPGGLPYIWVP